jgi:ubiquinone/menaquinone biosynthesis C-methylase UbiE
MPRRSPVAERIHLQAGWYWLKASHMAASASVAPNRWNEDKCARAFWGQQELPAYRQLLEDTLDWARPGPGEDWLDLGCGGGAITRELWKQSSGMIGSITGVDCAPINARKYEELREELSPSPGQRIGFVCHNFSAGGLAQFADASFDHAVSGLSISYAESYDENSGAWTDRAYDRLLVEVLRVIRPGGRFVFSVNVPEPSWMKVALRSLGGVFGSARPLQSLKKSVRMLRYGAWLKQEARRGRFHYFPCETVRAKLHSAGYADIRHRVSYAGQAYLFRATKKS